MPAAQGCLFFSQTTHHLYSPPHVLPARFRPNSPSPPHYSFRSTEINDAARPRLLKSHYKDKVRIVIGRPSLEWFPNLGAPIPNLKCWQRRHDDCRVRTQRETTQKQKPEKKDLPVAEAPECCCCLPLGSLNRTVLKPLDRLPPSTQSTHQNGVLKTCFSSL